MIESGKRTQAVLATRSDVYLTKVLIRGSVKEGELNRCNDPGSEGYTQRRSAGKRTVRPTSV